MKNDTVIAGATTVAIAAHLILRFFVPQNALPAGAAGWPLWIALVAGGGPLIWRLVESLARGAFGADWLAGISIVTAVLLGEYLVGAIVAPGMVMASGLERIKERFGTEDSRFLIAFKGLDLRGLISELRESEKAGEPLALLGATWGFDYFFDSCRKEGIRFCLPEGSRIVDSGGYVGRYTKCTKEEFFRKCWEVLGISENHCLNALWLCESSTVYFDNVLRRCQASRGNDARRCLRGAEQSLSIR